MRKKQWIWLTVVLSICFVVSSIVASYQTLQTFHLKEKMANQYVSIIRILHHQVDDETIEEWIEKASQDNYGEVYFQLEGLKYRFTLIPNLGGEVPYNALNKMSKLLRDYEENQETFDNKTRQAKITEIEEEFQFFRKIIMQLEQRVVVQIESSFGYLRLYDSINDFNSELNKVLMEEFQEHAGKDENLPSNS